MVTIRWQHNNERAFALSEAFRQNILCYTFDTLMLQIDFSPQGHLMLIEKIKLEKRIAERYVELVDHINRPKPDKVRIAHLEKLLESDYEKLNLLTCQSAPLEKSLA